ncbi:MAG: ATP-binding protein [Stellaceae bacterium]
MDAEPNPADQAALVERIRELETRLQESEGTLDAIRRGDIDAVVMSRQAEVYRVYTLENADRPYRVLIEHIQEGAVTLAEDGTVLYCNRRLADMLGVPHERVIGRGLQPFVRPEDAAAFARLLDAAKRHGVRRELTLLTASGRELPVYISLNLLQRDSGVTLLCGVLADLTEQKLHTRELAQSNARLLAQIAERERLEETLRQAQKMEAVGQLTGGLAHDFNNLLTAISGNLELLQAGVAQRRLPEASRYIAAAQGAADRAAALTHRLLAFSRRQTLDPVPTDANRLIGGMVELIRRTMGPAIMVETALAEDLWPTLCDPNQLENAILNLSINARDAMPEGGRLTTQTENVRLDRDGAIERGVSPGQYVTVCVTDTGAGMPPDVVARAFDPFFTTKPSGVGTGLGLSMIYGFAQQSGGQARIDSEPGRGTTVRLYLPRHAAEEASESADATAPPPSPERIEDQPN